MYRNIKAIPYTGQDLNKIAYEYNGTIEGCAKEEKSYILEAEYYTEKKDEISLYYCCTHRPLRLGMKSIAAALEELDKTYELAHISALEVSDQISMFRKWIL